MFSNPLGVNYHILPFACLMHFCIAKNALRMEFSRNMSPLTFLSPTFRFVLSFYTTNGFFFENLDRSSTEYTVSIKSRKGTSISSL